ncbi:MAG: hypothetical protein HC933_14870 [Pleurocapsa sp. SU_196_0]|nr:hypothetical protein [Pleurocapsa sp. SU_196_0]
MFAVTAATDAKPNKNKVETVKVQSRHLRGPLDVELPNDQDHFSEDGTLILKFHGIYQQDDRDLRKTGKKFIFMIRGRIPGGVLSPKGYLTYDDVNEALPDNMSDPDEMETIMNRLRQMEIEIVDASEVDRVKDGKKQEDQQETAKATACIAAA